LGQVLNEGNFMAHHTLTADPFLRARRREPPLVFLSKAAVLSLALFILAGIVLSRYSVHVDPQVRTSFPFRLWVLDEGDTAVGLGDYVAFHSDERQAKYFPAGTPLVKRVMAVPGDHVVVHGRDIWINGQWVEALYLTDFLGKPLSAFARDFTVPPHHYWVMATSPYSYDSRYWGTISQSEIIGQGYPIW